MTILSQLIKKRVLTTVLVLIAVIMGGLSYFAMGVRRFPDIDFPMAVIVTTYPGATPEEIESEITINIEDAISTVSGIDEIQSYSQHGMSLVMVQFDLEEDIDIKAMDLRDEIDLIRGRLPDDAEDPIVRKFDFEQIPVVTLALTGDYDVNELFQLAEDHLEDRLAQLPGVAEVDITGGQRREIQVRLSPIKLRAYGIPIGQVSSALRAANIEVSAGEVKEPLREYTIRTVGKFQNVDEISDIPVVKNEYSTVYLHHLGEVVDTFEDEDTRSRADGRSSVVLTIQKQADANDVEISDAVQALMPQLQELLPGSTEIFITEDTSDFIRGALGNVRTNIIIGIILTALALYLFFSSWRGTIIAGVVMPSALVMAFIFMMFSGVSVNILTLTALALSVGIVVNNSILILENANRFVEEGMEPVEAAIKGTKDIGLAIVSSTATNLVVFLPIAFMGEIIGRFFSEFGLTIVFVTTVSLFVSFTLTPMMCGLLLKSNHDTQVNNWFFSLLHFPPKVWQWCVEWLRTNYLGVLDWCLRWRKTTLLLTVLLVVVSMIGMFKVVGAEFFPRSDEGSFRITVETALGSSLDWTAGRVEEIERIIEEHIPEEYLERYYSRVGTASGFVGGVSEGTHLGEVSVTLIDALDRPESVYKILNDIRPYLANVHSVQMTATTETGGGPGADPIEIDIYGNDIEELREVTAQIMEATVNTRGTADVQQSYRTGRPDITFTPDHSRLKRHNLTANEIARELRTFIEGATATQLFDAGEEYDIRVRFDERYRKWSGDISGFFVSSPATGSMVPVTELGRVEYVASPVSIMRKDRQRLITVSSQLTGERSLGEVRDDIARAIDELDISDDVRIDFAGEVELMRDNFRELYQAMGTAGVLTFLCTAGIIESFFLAVIIILSIPVSFIGVVLALILGGVALNIFSLMAMIMLVGMVVNNAIIVLDYATRPEQQQLPPWRRVYDACALRFRVLLMANLTTVAAMVPLSLGLGFGGEIFRPLALVQIGGIIAAGSLALLVIPVIYTSWYNLIEHHKDAN